MTYAGVKSMIYCGVSKDDERIKKAYQWIQKHYTVDANPGMPEAGAQRGLYYYYHTMAKCLDALGVDEVVDANGVHHDWRATSPPPWPSGSDPTAAGRTTTPSGWKARTDLVTGYALMALSHCKPK